MISAAAELDDDTLETVLPVIATQTEDFGTLAALVGQYGTGGAADVGIAQIYGDL